MTNINVLYLAGMGGDKSGSHDEMVYHLSDKLGEDVKLNVKSVLYLTEINKNQRIAMDRMGGVGLMKIRRLLMNSFSDAVSVNYNSEAYLAVMDQISKGVRSLTENNNYPLYVITHSLGCHIFSCWMYDQQKKGLEHPFIKGWFSTGNNMRVFYNGIKREQIIPFKRPSDEFVWYNFWSKSDPLSFPMTNVNEAYDELLTKDVKVRGFPIISHSKYDKRKKVYKTIAKEMERSAKSL